MTRVKRGAVARKRREKILQISNGFQGSSSCLFRIANQRALKSLKLAYFDRRYKKRNFRSLWITRINAGVRNNNSQLKNYSIFISKLKNSSLALNRKILASLAVKDISAFNQVQALINTPSMANSSGV